MLDRVSPLELLQAREDIIRTTFDLTVETWRPVLTPDGRGGSTSSLGFIESGPGRLAPTNAQAAEYYADRVGLRKSWIVTIPVERTLQLADQLRISGRRFEVIDRIPEQTLNISHRVAVVEIE